MRELDGKAIMVVEDDYLQASDLKRTLVGAGAEVRGPYAHEDAAIAALSAGKPDAALLDLNLGDGVTTAVADACARAGVPFAFVTGYDLAPPPWGHVPIAPKPVERPSLLQLVKDMLGDARP